VKNGLALSSPLFHTLTDAPTPSSAGIFAPQLASTTMGFGFLSSMGFLYNRYFPPLSSQRLAVTPGSNAQFPISRPYCTVSPALLRIITLFFVPPFSTAFFQRQRSRTHPYTDTDTPRRRRHMTQTNPSQLKPPLIRPCFPPPDLVHVRRGTPDIVRDDMGNPGESRPANYGALGKTLGICAIFGGIGFALGNVILTSFALPASIQPDAVINSLFNIGLWVAAMFFQVQDDM
jgi:hypothetical protein